MGDVVRESWPLLLQVRAHARMSLHGHKSGSAAEAIALKFGAETSDADLVKAAQ